MASRELPLVVFLAGDRELHCPGRTLGTTGTLDEQVAAAAGLPIADPPDPDPQRRPVTVEAGTVQCLRLDRLAQTLPSLGFNAPFRMLFVLTDQQPSDHSVRDTVQLRPILQRWCDQRGHDYEDVVVGGRPSLLDDGGAELIAQLDPVLGVAGDVVLVIGGGPPALQIAAHFASFQGVRHRDSLTVLQLQEVVDSVASAVGDGPHESPGPAVRRTRQPASDTSVQVVDRFHGLVGRRTIDTQALLMLDQFDLPGAAQLLQASASAGLHAASIGELASDLLASLARSSPAQDPVARLNTAVDLAEVEWSRPGGSPAEAIWYAMLAVVELLPGAWSHIHPERREIRLNEDQVKQFNRAVDRGRFDDEYTALRSTPRYLRERVAPLLTAAPGVLSLPGRSVDIAQILGEHHRGDDPAASVTWMALYIASKQLRNDHAHDLIVVEPDQAPTIMAEAAEEDFARALRVLAGDILPTDDQKPARLASRLAAIRAQITQDPQSGAPRSRRQRQRPGALIEKLVTTPEKVDDADVRPLLMDEGSSVDRFARLAGPDVEVGRTRLLAAMERFEADHVTLPDRLLSLIDPPAAGHAAALDLLIDAERPASRFRRTCQQVVGDLADDNRAVTLAAQLRAELTGP